MKVFLTYSGYPRDTGMPDAMRIVRNYLSVHPHHHEEASDLSQADTVLFFEGASYKGSAYLRHLANNPLVRQAEDRCFVFDESDNPHGLLPGIYPSIGRAVLQASRGRCATFAYISFEHISEWARKAPNCPPKLLFSFRGFASSRVRERLFACSFPPDIGRVEQSFDWQTYTLDDRRRYWLSLLEAKFGLCPAGYGSSTYRLFEVMAAGRVPVIISDNWAPFHGPDWKACSVTVAEKDIEAIPDILSQYDEQWMAMARAAQSAFYDWITPDRSPGHLLDMFASLSKSMPSRRADPDSRVNWGTWAHNWRHGWTLPQRVGRRLGRMVF